MVICKISCRSGCNKIRRLINFRIFFTKNFDFGNKTEKMRFQYFEKALRIVLEILMKINFHKAQVE